MKAKILTLIVFFCTFNLQAQSLSDQMGSAYSDFEIAKFIKTSNDFEQEGMTLDEIDRRIDEIIQQNNKDFLSLDVPINNKKVEYLGYIYPKQTNIFFTDIDSTLILNKLTNIYRYDNLYISTSTNSLRDRYLVYYTIRDYLIIKSRLKLINDALFKITSKIPENYIRLGNSNINFINFNENYFISFDGTNSLPTSEFYFGQIITNYFGNTKSKQLSHNTHVLYFNRNTINNGGSSGDVAIYKSAIGDNLFHNYMKDGFIHSFIHERLHNYISNSLLFNPLAYLIRKGCIENKIIDDYYKEFEEPIVNNTTNVLFEMLTENGGLSTDVLKFYEIEFDRSIEALKKSEKLQKVTTALTPYYNRGLLYSYFGGDKFRNDINRQFLFINFADNRNQPIALSNSYFNTNLLYFQQLIQQQKEQKEQEEQFKKRMEDPVFKQQYKEQQRQQKQQMERQRQQMEYQRNMQNYQYYFQQSQVQQR